jgi:branched-subunit amino acid transport protein
MAVLTAVFLPEILFRTVFGNGTSAMNPEILSWVPTISYLVTAVVFLALTIGNVMKWTKIRQLERMLEMAK